MANLVKLGAHNHGLWATTRKDGWWFGPLVTFLGLSAFILYATWAALQGQYYYSDPYLSPMYAPLLFLDPRAPGGGTVEMAWFGLYPDGLFSLVNQVHWAFSFLPEWLLTPYSLVSPAILILIFPLSFRLTCYYYRKAYYRSFALTPPACAVQGIRERKYRGETFILLFQNFHRIAMYFAVAFIFILSYDAAISFFKGGKFGIGVGSIVQSLNAILLAAYTFGCHSFRHLIGGYRDEFTCGRGAPMAHRVWLGCSKLNANHMVFAWMSLFWVGFTDFYIRMVSMGVITDLNTWD